ncbi:hypothetical protein ES708_01410 [subsurface metagenome]
MDVSCRQIAKVLARGMPVEGEEYSQIIEGYIKTLEALPDEQLQALRASYIFSGQAPQEERQDLFQELVSHTLTALSSYDSHITDLEAFCYTVAKHKWNDFWDKKKRRKEILNGGFVSLNEPVQTREKEEIDLQELIAGEVKSESKLISELNAQAVFSTLPDKIKAIVQKRLDNKRQKRGRTISSAECTMLWRYAKQNGDKIRELITA